MKKEKLIEIRNGLKELIKKEMELKDQTKLKSKVFRIHYVKNRYKGAKVNKSEYISLPFKINAPISNKDALKIISYLSDVAKNQLFARENHLLKAIILNRELDNEDLKIEKLDKCEEYLITDLYIVDGNKTLFKMSKDYNTYFNWYIPNVSYEDIIDICNKYNLNEPEKQLTLKL